MTDSFFDSFDSLFEMLKGLTPESKWDALKLAVAAMRDADVQRSMERIEAEQFAEIEASRRQSEEWNASAGKNCSAPGTFQGGRLESFCVNNPCDTGFS